MTVEPDHGPTEGPAHGLRRALDLVLDVGAVGDRMLDAVARSWGAAGRALIRPRYRAARRCVRALLALPASAEEAPDATLRRFGLNLACPFSGGAASPPRRLPSSGSRRAPRCGSPRGHRRSGGRRRRPRRRCRRRCARGVVEDRVHLPDLDLVGRYRPASALDRRVVDRLAVVDHVSA